MCRLKSKDIRLKVTVTIKLCKVWCRLQAAASRLDDNVAVSSHNPVISAVSSMPVPLSIPSVLLLAELDVEGDLG